MQAYRSVVASCLTAMSLTACASSPPTPTSAPNSANKLKVVATFSVLGDFVRNVAGENIQVTVLVGPDGDTHEYEPSPSDSAALSDADVIVENGLEFESWLDNLYTASRSKAKRVIASAGVVTIKGESHQEHKEVAKANQAEHAEADPHIWHDVKRAMQMVSNIEAGLSAADTANAATYKANAQAYLKKLETLDAEIMQQTTVLSTTQRKLVTSHDALGYYAARYGFEIIGSVIASISTEAGEPSAKDFADLTNAIRATGAKAIFLETISNPALVERIAKEADVKVGPALYTDALGAPGSSGATYIEAMRENTQAIVSALQ